MSVIREVIESPVFAVLLTVGVFASVQVLFRRWSGAAWANPVLWSMVVVGGVLVLTDVPYSVYAEGTQALTFLLGPAIVALALPVFTNLRRLREALPAVLGSTAVASAVGVAVGVLGMLVLGASRAEILAMAPAHATAAVSATVADAMGASRSLAATLAVTTGVIGAMLGPIVFRLLRIRDERAQGIAFGVSAHAIGTARALHESETAGSFSAVGMALAAIAVAALTPLALLVLPA